MKEQTHILAYFLSALLVDIALTSDDSPQHVLYRRFHIDPTVLQSLFVFCSIFRYAGILSRSASHHLPCTVAIRG